MCIACAAAVPICSTGSCASPSIFGQLAISIGLPLFIAITLLRSWLMLIASQYLPAIFTRKIFK